MSFKGLTSALLLIIALSALVGGMVTNDLSRPSVAMAQARADPTPAVEPTVTADEQQPGEGEENGQQDDPAALLETLRAWESDLREWQEQLEARETGAAADRATLEAERAALDAEWATLAGEQAEVQRQFSEIETAWDRLARQQDALQAGRVDLATRERQARTLAGRGGAMLIVAVVAAIACAAVVAYRPADRRAARAAATPKGKEVRPLRLRPKQTPQPTAASEVQAYLEETPSAPVGQPRGNGNGNGNGRHGRVL